MFPLTQPVETVQILCHAQKNSHFVETCFTFDDACVQPGAETPISCLLHGSVAVV